MIRTRFETYFEAGAFVVYWHPEESASESDQDFAAFSRQEDAETWADMLKEAGVPE